MKRKLWLYPNEKSPELDFVQEPFHLDIESQLPFHAYFKRTTDFLQAHVNDRIHFSKKLWSKKSKKYGELCYFLNLLLLECSVVELKTVTSQPYCARTQCIGGEETE